MYPLGMLLRLKRKAEEIWRRKEVPVKNECDFLVVPYWRRAAPINRLLSGAGLRVVHCAGTSSPTRKNKQHQQHHLQNSLQRVLSCIHWWNVTGGTEKNIRAQKWLTPPQNIKFVGYTCQGQGTPPQLEGCNDSTYRKKEKKNNGGGLHHHRGNNQSQGRVRVSFPRGSSTLHPGIKKTRSNSHQLAAWSAKNVYILLCSVSLYHSLWRSLIGETLEE